MKKNQESPLFGNNICKRVKVLGLGLLLLSANHLFAQQSEDDILSKVIPLKNKAYNDIPLLDNRFRIDDDVNEVTLIFFRVQGSAPIVLVRPDGSKFFLENDSTDDRFTWYETDSYDMITLKAPMPGPWQAVGEIKPESRIIVVANIQLRTDDIPSPLFRGETLKMEAHLENAGKKVDFSEFRNVVSLSLEFSSTNNPNYENFGMGTRTVARFEDSGEGFDERPRDGIFTGQFSVDIPAGEWQPTASVRTPLLSREKVLPNIILQATPVSIRHSAAEQEEGTHQFIVDVDESWIRSRSVLLDGTVRLPNGDVRRVSFTESTQGPKFIDVINIGYGTYLAQLTVFAQGNDGRDLVINMPSYSFITEAPFVEETAIEQEVTGDIADSAELTEPEETMSPLMIALIVNLSLIIIGGAVIFTLWDKRQHPDNPWYKKVLTLIKSKLPSKKSEALEDLPG